MSTKTNPLASPKARFLETASNVTNHHSLVDSEAFNRAIDTALLEFQAKCASELKDPNGAMAAGLKIAGAQEFVYILKGLSEVPKPLPKPVILDNLPDDSQNRRQ